MNKIVLTVAVASLLSSSVQAMEENKQAEKSAPQITVHPLPLEQATQLTLAQMHEGVRKKAQELLEIFDHGIGRVKDEAPEAGAELAQYLEDRKRQLREVMAEKVDKAEPAGREHAHGD